MIPTFPQFKALSLDDKDTYNALVADYPPLSNISFTSMHIWGNLEQKMELSLLNGNVVIYYYISTDAKNTGYSLIGRQDLAASIATLFAWLKEQQLPVRLIHVPEFVIKQLDQPQAYIVEEELDYNEYILDSQALATLEDPAHGRTRRKVNRFVRDNEDSQLEVKPLDLSTAEAKQELLQAIEAWEQARPTANDPDNTEHLALQRTLDNSEVLDVKQLGLYIDGKLAAIVLYHQPLDKNYYILNHLKVDYRYPYVFDYMTQQIAKQAASDNVAYLNMEMDLGIENLRRHKLGLRPVDFFRQYSISPA